MSYFDNKTVLSQVEQVCGTNFVKELCKFNTNIIVPIHKRIELRVRKNQNN